MSLTEEIEDKAEELAEMARLDGTENGEWWAALAGMRRFLHYGATDRFIKAWTAEVKAEHKRLKRDFEVTETVQEVKRTVRTLEFIG
jgi:hypothetical protein